METILPAEAPEEEPIVRSFATVGTVYADGVSLIFDGEDQETEKHYLCNTSATFAPGDRVKIAQDSGTYIVEYVVGPPGTAPEAHGLPAGGSQGQILTKESATDYDAGWENVPDPTKLAGQYHSVELVDNSSASAELRPSVGPTASNGVGLGTSQYPFKDCYLGGQYGAVHIGGANAYNSKIGFYGATPEVKQTISLSSDNMGYTSVTASNYLHAINNLIGILKNKYGLIT